MSWEKRQCECQRATWCAAFGSRGWRIDMQRYAINIDKSEITSVLDEVPKCAGLAYGKWARGSRAHDLACDIQEISRPQASPLMYLPNTLPSRWKSPEMHGFFFLNLIIDKPLFDRIYRDFGMLWGVPEQCGKRSGAQHAQFAASWIWQKDEGFGSVKMML